MKKKLHYLCLCGALMLPLGSAAQLALDETQVPENADNEPAPVHPVPSERQLLWNETEFYGFFHYGMNTFSHLESAWKPRAQPGHQDKKRYRFACQPTIVPALPFSGFR